MTEAVKERVYAAAERISADRNPTVSSVREAAGVSNADATRYLKQWREEKAAAGTQIAATPQAVLEHAARLAGTVWAEAARMADERHAAVQARWEGERREKDQELAELVADLDRTTAEKDKELERLARELQAAAQRLEGAEANAAEALRAADSAREENNRLRTELAAAEARTATLQQTIDALLQRITPPETPDTASGGGEQADDHQD
ncbi:KfrA protein [Arthrobacter crystallopoietes BAB-32]|uniref:KfrA protein n=1 Tax=Arthrobacter crystallopoietes BAB-32 TaxID=1246476 RepID=N1V9N5_9MICC|nr:DNA-binding protein [Arthrobacter crystallopoietes]EMY34998.1 KfrA protein [Arthrobacter crystallopoietes BAB-32]